MKPGFDFTPAPDLQPFGLDRFFFPWWAGPAALFVAAVIYCIPGIVALVRSHHNRLAIVLLNLLLGWTFVGWVAALVWSATTVRRKGG